MTKMIYKTEFVYPKLRTSKNVELIQPILDKYSADGFRLNSVQSIEMLGCLMFIFEKEDEEIESLL